MCPFRIDCAEYAIAEPMIRGVWGGTTEIDRRRIRHARRLESTKTLDASLAQGLASDPGTQ
jgi:hypothetical protein